MNHNPMPDLHRAIRFATEAHFGQPDKKTGEPYIFHPLRVMEIGRRLLRESDLPLGVLAMGSRLTMAEGALIVCVLHDTIEDTEVEEVDVQREFGVWVSRRVRTLSNLPGDHDTYDTFIEVCTHDAVTKIVKSADIIDHLSRLPAINELHTEKEIAWRQKYEMAAGILDIPIPRHPGETFLMPRP